MAIIKLTEPSQAHTMTIAKVEDDRSGNYPDWKFTGDTGDVLHIPQKAMERQLTRLGVSSAFDLRGVNVRFSRSDKPGTNGKLFYNCDLAGPPAAPSQRVQPPPRQAPVTVAPPRGPDKHIPGLDDGPPDWSDVPNEDTPYAEPKQTPREQAQGTPEARRASIERHYLALHARVAAAVVENHVKAHAVVNVPDLATAIQSATATIWISWKDAGVRV